MVPLFTGNLDPVSDLFVVAQKPKAAALDVGLDSVRVPSKICDGAAALAGTAKPVMSSTGDEGTVFDRSSPYVRTLRFTLPVPISGSPGRVTARAERKVGPREANVAHDNSPAK